MPNLNNTSKGKITRKKGVTLLLLVFTIAIISSFTLHPYHVSTTEIAYKEGVNTLTFSTEIFTNDLESAVKKVHPDQKFFLGTALPHATELLLQEYIKSHISIRINEVEITDLDFLPAESNPDRTTVYFQLTNLPELTKLSYASTLLNHYLPDHTNIVSFLYRGRVLKATLGMNNSLIDWKLE